MERKIYLYDGTYTGLLTALSVIEKKREKPGNICPKGSYRPGLFDKIITITTDPAETADFLNTLEKVLVRRSLDHIFRVFLSSVQHKEMAIYRYVRLGFETQKKLDYFLSDERVKFIHDHARKVSVEAHRMRGLVRFRELQDGWLYAPIETDHYVLPLIIRHFSQRLPQKQWFIHDIKRKKIAIHNLTYPRIFDVKNYRVPELSFKEAEHQKIWQEYFKNIAIKDRKNVRLQRQFMPKRYWKYLTEMEVIHNEETCTRYHP
ncbi:MAG: TIGR03915 family putative DNA repair protein [Candidatus Omnitrophica bacterium]|nr:TIGR03915 family putative DNA repair protein [Candidatus Omnitrophota bacterium]